MAGKRPKRCICLFVDGNFYRDLLSSFDDGETFETKNSLSVEKSRKRTLAFSRLKLKGFEDPGCLWDNSPMLKS